MQKEAKARLKINELLTISGWRLLDSDKGPARVQVETHTRLEDMGENFEKAPHGFIDYLLTDDSGFPVAVLEAKSEEKHPLVGKDQARDYAKSQRCRYVILSNGNQHFFWDLESGNPMPVSHFPSLETLQGHVGFKPDVHLLTDEKVGSDYVVMTQAPGYESDPRWADAATKGEVIDQLGLRFLRRYQLDAVSALQRAAGEGKKSFLFEMATGTGKTLTAAAIIKLFLRTKNARRVLFLVDRLELENQAKKAFINYLKNDYQTVVFKESRDDWKKAEIVVTTIQSISHNNKYLSLFSPTDFDLVISDEAHRSVSGSGRVLFNFFLGYKLGLTATPKDYLKNVDQAGLDEMDSRELERRQLLSTYQAFGCESGEPTFRYSLTDGVSDPEGPYLVNPTTLDCRTDITTQLLSEDGYKTTGLDDDGQEVELTFRHKDFERKFFSEETNRQFAETFFQHADCDPVSGEVGKTIMFAVSRKHAAKLTQALCVAATKYFPEQYGKGSDFAVQITSDVEGAQQKTISFANNNLNGHSEWLEGYKTSRTRVCVTVGMMTTGYDCQDLLNVALVRPIFSPTDFIQIKGRGTRTFGFKSPQGVKYPKPGFKLFDFFANCEFFEEKFPYDEVIKLPKAQEPRSPEPIPGGISVVRDGDFTSSVYDPLATITTHEYGSSGMRIDREMYSRFENKVKESYNTNADFKDVVDSGDREAEAQFVKENIFNKPSEYFDLEKLRKSYQADRRLSLSEILDKVFGRIAHFKTKNDLAKEEFEQYKIAEDIQPDQFYEVREFFKAYLADGEVKAKVDAKKYGEFSSNPEFSYVLHKVGGPQIEKIKTYVHDNVNLNKFN